MLSILLLHPFTVAVYTEDVIEEVPALELIHGVAIDVKDESKIPEVLGAQREDVAILESLLVQRRVGFAFLRARSAAAAARASSAIVFSCCSPASRMA